MKYIVEFELTKTDDDAPKGEELEAAILEGLYSLEVEGYEIDAKSIKLHQRVPQDAKVRFLQGRIEGIRRVLTGEYKELISDVPSQFKSETDWAIYLCDLALSESNKR